MMPMKLNGMYRGGAALLLLTFTLSTARLSAQQQSGELKRSGHGSSAKHAPSAPLDFDLDVRPILSENCFKCHGFDPGQRQAGLRLDIAESALSKLASGRAAIVPGDLKASELVERISLHGGIQMPPPGSGKTLTAGQIATLKRWVAEGAHYKLHWAFVAPVRPAIPAVHNKRWPRNPIDYFVLARLEKEGLPPSPEADKATLLRRVTQDLTGLPPTLAELDAFLTDQSPDAYEKVVDRLLASPHYGERMALTWLDLARYADTHGYHIDSQRDMWPWRNWVINAYNTNLPYDQFTVQQIAGDLLPNATLDQRIATGFNRNHPIDFEGGAIPEEYAANYIFDRIDTTATAFMGLTMRCGQCHDHKYDPISQKDYYRFFAFFHNVPENGLDGQTGNAVPYIKAPTPDQQAQLDTLNKKLAEEDAALKARKAEIAPAQAAWEQTALASLDKLTPVSDGLLAHYQFNEGAGMQLHDSTGKVSLARLEGKPAWGKGQSGGALTLDGATYADLGSAITLERTQKFSYGAWVYPTGSGAMTVVSRMNDAANFRGWDMFISGGTVFVHLIHEWEKNAIRVNTKTPIPLNQWTHLFVTYDGSSKAAGVTIYVNGKQADLDRTHDSLTDTIQATTPVYIGRRNPGAPFQGMISDLRIYDRQLSSAEVGQLVSLEPIRQALAVAPDKRTAEQKETLAVYYRQNLDAPYKQLSAVRDATLQQRNSLDAAIPTTMVMDELPKPRDTFVLIRGQYDKPGEKVTAGTPAFLPPLPADLPPNRLALAKWLVSPTHPLTARVAVNRYWQQVFGVGIVKSSENFGTQGDRPTHPELLDWLATELIRTGWDQKAMMRLLVTSATYRQSSHASPALRERDPENRLLARAPRYRLAAEFVRDQALAISGLLVPKIGGPSVKPYQPPGLWEELAFGGGFSAQTYVQDHGENLYRRSMYTFWKRTCPPPTLQAFDAPEREFCIVRRSVTDTPLQALALMNDPTYIEAARKFAERLFHEAGDLPQARLNYAYRLALSRTPNPTESKLLLSVFADQLNRFHKDPESAKKLLMVGESPYDSKRDPAELAAWSMVCSMILNLDETITRN